MATKMARQSEKLSSGLKPVEVVLVALDIARRGVKQ